MTILPSSAISEQAWDDFALSHPEGWLFHTRAWLRYRADRTGGAIDRSFGCVDSSGKLVGICPLMEEQNALSTDPGNKVCTWLSGVEPGPVPIASTPEGVTGIADHFVALEAECRPRYWAFQHRPRRACEGQPPGVAASWLTEVIDLSLPIETILHRFRKANRSGRTDVRKLAVQYQVVSGPEHLRELVIDHIRFWGGKTWTERRWGIVADWLDCGTARLYGIPEQAWALVYVFKGWAYYAAGPSFDRSIGLPALCQWAAIQALKADGVLHYEMGWHARPGEGEKHQRVAAFKQGFGGEKWTIWVMASGEIKA